MRTARAAWLLVALNAAPLAAEDLPSARRNFVACPIVRDTASVPCWLAEYDGELYKQPRAAIRSHQMTWSG